MLKTINLTKKFGGIKALNKVNIQVNKKEIVGIIGPNGSGKTTLFNLITGFIKPTYGKIIFLNKEIQNLPPSKIVKLRIARTFQIVKPLKNLTVFENILYACGYLNYFGFSFFKKINEEKYYKKTEEIIKELNLKDYESILAKNLPLGVQKKLEIARALALDPLLLLIDEPTAGMSYEESLDLKKLIKKIRNEGITIMLIEHNVPFAREVSDRMYVLNYGEVIAEGNTNEVIKNKKVIEAYLGEESVS